MKEKKEDFEGLDSGYTENKLNFKALFFRYLSYWPWFVLSITLCCIVAWGYAKYVTPVYKVSASILIKDKEKGNQLGGSSLEDLSNLGLISSTSNVDNEMGILYSRTLMKKVVEELDLYITYYTKESFRHRELYKSSPVKVWLTPEESDKLPNGSATLDLTFLPDNVVEVKTIIEEQEYSAQFKKLPALLTTPYGVFSFLADSLATANHNQISVVITSSVIIADSYKKALSIEWALPKTSIAELSIQSTNQERGIDVLNKLVEVYNRDANDDKNDVATKTAQFIEERLRIINSELDVTEGKLEAFKRGAGLTDVKSDAQLALKENSEYEKMCAENNTQLQLIGFLSNYANVPEQIYEVLPVNVGLADTGLADLIKRYNEMLLERKRLLRTSSESNPVLVNLDNSIRAMRNSVQTSISSIQKGLLITKADLERQTSKYIGRINNAPQQERQLINISRQQEIKSGLYLMLLQKREENAITLAATANNARVIDTPLPDFKPVSPRRKVILLVAFIIGGLIPIVIIFIRDLFRYKIEDRSDIEKMTAVPIIGDIPSVSDISKNGSIVVRENQNDMMAETFRNVRTNIQYMLKKEQKVILVTSTISGEGKSFISANIAVSFALLGKKVVVVGLDIRKPGLNKVFQLPRRERGISQFLADPESVNLMDLVLTSPVNTNLGILPGGIVPPNPTELVARESLEQAIELLKTKFDYIILDTAPIGLVTDTQIIARVADLSVYVCRAEYTPKADYSLINELYRSSKLPNLCTVVNALDVKKKRYGYYYNYGKYGKHYGYGHKYGYGAGYSED